MEVTQSNSLKQTQLCQLGWFKCSQSPMSRKVLAEHKIFVYFLMNPKENENQRLSKKKSILIFQLSFTYATILIAFEQNIL